jgi:hypothetical protein
MEFFSGLDVSMAHGDLRGRRQGRGADADGGRDRTAWPSQSGDLG